MGTFNTGIIQSTGDERSFLTLIYNHIMNLWNGITCSVKNGDDDIISSATPDDFVWGADTVSYIEFKLDSVSSLRFTSHPRNASDKRTRAYSIAFIVNSSIIVDRGGTSQTDMRGVGVPFCGNSGFVGDGLSPETAGTRTWICSEYLSDNVKILWFASKDATTYKDSLVTIVMLKDTNANWHYGGTGTGFNPETSDIYDSTASSVATKSNLFSFEARTGYLDFISHSSFVSGSTKAFTSTDIYDCTTVNFGDTLSLKDGANFLAIGAHSMVRLDEEG